jgi:hypothetical protein
MRFIFRDGGVMKLPYLLVCIVWLCMQHEIGYTAEQEYDRLAWFKTCTRVGAAVMYKICSFLAKHKTVYTLDEHVLQNPYKKMVYTSCINIEALFDYANCHDNPCAQIYAILMLFRTPVPACYIKHFTKGLRVLLASCFDDQGNFVQVGYQQDIRCLFKDYCHKVPQSWQRVAKISAWKSKRESVHPLYSDYYGFTCTSANHMLLELIGAIQDCNDEYVDYLATRYQIPVMRQLYDYYQLKYSKRVLENQKMYKELKNDDA